MEQVLAARALHSLLIGLLLWAIPWLVVVVPLVVVRKAGAMAGTVLIVSVAIVSLRLIQQRRVRLASWVFLITLSIVTTGVVLASGGIHSVALASQMSVLVTASWLLGRRVAEFAWGGFLIFTLVLALLDVTGHPLPAYFPLPALPLWMGLLLTTALTALPLGQILRYLNSSLSTAERQLEELQISQASLRENEAKYRIIFESARDAMFVLEPETWLIRSVNPAGVALLRRPVSEIEGRSYQDLVTWEATQIDTPLNGAAKSGSGVWEGSIRIGGSDPVPVEVSANAVDDADGGTLMVAIVRDISERKRGMAERAALKDQLAQAQRLESLGRLAGGVAHDFNNLLTVMNGYTDLCLLKLRESDPLYVPLSSTRSAGEEAAGLVKQLFTFSRKQVMEPKLVDCSELVSEHLGILRRLVREDIELVMRLAPGLRAVLADPVQLRQVIINLILNGRDAMPDGGKLVIETGEIQIVLDAVRLPDELPPGRYVTLAVSDTGIGMNDETIVRVFEPFFTTKQPGSGTGLGLSTAYGVVRQCGGTIRVASTPGKGSTFTVLLPSVEELAGVDVSPSKLKGLRRGSETILVVEDQDAVRRVTVAVLADLGYRVLQAENGEDALRLAGQHALGIDLVVTDMVMPGMPGTELAARLLQIIPTIRVLFVSGYAEVAGPEDGLDLLRKPFPAEVLATKVRELLAQVKR